MPIGDIGGLSVPSFSASIMEDLATGLGRVPDILQEKKRDKEDRADTMRIRDYNTDVRDSEGFSQAVKEYLAGNIDKATLQKKSDIYHRSIPMKSGQQSSKMTSLADNMPAMAEPMKPGAPGSSIVATPAPRTPSGPVVGPNQATATTTEIPMRSQSISSNTVNGGKIGQSVEPKVQKPQGIGAPASVLSSNHPLVQSIAKATGQNPMAVAQQLAKQSIGSGDDIDMARLQGKDFTYMNQAEQSTTLSTLSSYPKAERGAAAADLGITNVPQHILDIQPEVFSKEARTNASKIDAEYKRLLTNPKNDPFSAESFYTNLNPELAAAMSITAPTHLEFAHAVVEHERYLAGGDQTRLAKIQKMDAETKGIMTKDDLDKWKMKHIASEIAIRPRELAIKEENSRIAGEKLGQQVIHWNAVLEAKKASGNGTLSLEMRRQVMANNNFKLFSTQLKDAKAALDTSRRLVSTLYGGKLPPGDETLTATIKEQEENVKSAQTIYDTMLNPGQEASIQNASSIVNASAPGGRSNLPGVNNSKPKWDGKIPSGSKMVVNPTTGVKYFQNEKGVWLNAATGEASS